MAPRTSIANLCRTRTLQHQEEAKNHVRALSEAIRKSADPLSDDKVMKPFMIPQGRDPYDVWYHILDKVTDPDDVSKLWEVCPLFREIACLKTKYIQTKLPEIVKLILDKRPSFLLENQDVRENGEDPRISPSNAILLDLRKISRQCKNSIEELFLQLQSTDDVGAKKLYLSLHTSERARSIIDSILGGEIKVDTIFPTNVKVGEFFAWNNEQVGIQQRAVLYEPVGILLELIGQRVKTFSCTSTAEEQEVYDKLREWILYMPNLENLHVSPLGFMFHLENFLNPAAVPTLEELPTFPNCPRLRSFIQKWTVLPEGYTQRILDQSPGITTFVQPTLLRNNFMAPDYINSTMRHLERFHTPLYPSLLSYREFQLPLKEIVLDSCGNHRIVSSSDLFPFLHQFRGSLERLEWDYLDVQETGKYFLDLPNLKFFKWSYNKTFEDMHFLLHAERLEDVQMKVAEIIPSSKDFFDRFVKKVTRGFDGLSLWQVFSHLKKFQIKFSMWGEHHEIYRQ